MTFIIKFSKILEVARKGNLVAGVAQVVERRIGSAEVTGPTPVASLYKLGEKDCSDDGWSFFYSFLTFNFVFS